MSDEMATLTCRTCLNSGASTWKNFQRTFRLFGDNFVRSDEYISLQTTRHLLNLRKLGLEPNIRGIFIMLQVTTMDLFNIFCISIFTDPQNWSEMQVLQWLNWAIREFSLEVKLLFIFLGFIIIIINCHEQCSTCFGQP